MARHFVLIGMKFSELHGKPVVVKEAVEAERFIVNPAGALVFYRTEADDLNNNAFRAVPPGLWMECEEAAELETETNIVGG